MARSALLAKEQSTFDARRPGWVRAGYEGRWMAVKGSRSLGPFARFAVAWKSAAKTFGNAKFLVDRVLPEKRPLVVTWIRKVAK